MTEVASNSDIQPNLLLVLVVLEVAVPVRTLDGGFRHPTLIHFPMVACHLPATQYDISVVMMN